MIQYRKNDIVEGIITNITSYGAFVLVDTQTNGLIHISEITSGFVSDISHFIHVGQRVYAKVLEVDEEKGQLKLSLKNVSKKVSPRYQRRERILKNKKQLVPKATIGFQSLSKKLPQWVEKGIENVKA